MDWGEIKWKLRMLKWERERTRIILATSASWATKEGKVARGAIKEKSQSQYLFWYLFFFWFWNEFFVKYFVHLLLFGLILLDKFLLLLFGVFFLRVKNYSWEPKLLLLNPNFWNSQVRVFNILHFYGSQNMIVYK